MRNLRSLICLTFRKSKACCKESVRESVLQEVELIDSKNRYQCYCGIALESCEVVFCSLALDIIVKVVFVSAVSP